MIIGKLLESYGSVKGGKLHISYRDRLIQALSEFPDCRIKLTIEKLYNKRSNPQNRYYWGVIVREACDGYYEATGEWKTAEDMHEILKAECNHKELVNPETGQILKVPQSTTGLSTVDMEIYLEKCRRFIDEWFNRRVPLPNEQAEADFERAEKEFKLITYSPN